LERRFFGAEGIADAVTSAVNELDAIRSIRATAQRFGTPFVDDVAVDTLWSGASPAPVVNIHFPPEPTHVGPIRHAIESVLKHAGLSDDRCADMVLAAGEALNNPVEHGSVPGRDNTIEVNCWTYPNEVIVEVRTPKTNWSVPTKPAGRTSRGHGLHLMRHLTDDFEIKQEPEGTIVTLKKHRQ
jgi:serine/threonine-protein kinase RsbW